jgi:hypothetical protein
VHDPLTVAFEIRRPWPELSRSELTPWSRVGEGNWVVRRSPFWILAGRRLYWPSMITIWHRDPSGYDNDVCLAGHRSRTWRFHVHHWRIQVVPLQKARRRLLTRCSDCGGRSTKAHPVNLGGWGRERGPWWRGETGLKHMNCTTTSKEQNRG